MKRALTPNALKRGDCIGVIAPAGQVTDVERFSRGISILEEMGFTPVFPSKLWPGQGYLADQDCNRAKELQRMLVNPEIKAVMAARGGYGCLRIVADLEFDFFSSAAKPIIGFSDISVLLNLIVDRTSLITFHGPVVTSLGSCNPATIERLYHVLCGNWQRQIEADKIEILRARPGRGRLLGGNLNSLMTLLGTTYDCNWQDAILVLEDINEPLYKIDRMFTQLMLAGKFDGLAGILIGQFSFTDEPDSIAKLRYCEAIWQRLLDLTDTSKIPVWGNFPVGHGADNLTLPLGAEAIMDSDTGTLRFG